MARIARKYYDTSFYHIMVQGIEKKLIFSKLCFKEKYRELIIKCAKLYDVSIIAYCIMDNHAHILIHTNNLMSMTRLMSSSNTSYGKYFNKTLNRVGYVFRDRYRCENIFTQNHLINCIRYIHENPIKAKICDKPEKYKFSSFNDYLRNNGIVNKEVLKLCDMNEENYAEIVMANSEFDKYIDEDTYYERAENVLKEILIKKGVSVGNFNESDLSEVAKEVISRSNAKKCEVANLLKIEKTKLNRIMKNYPK
jgi:REP element-mobilizing transposase RayT